MDEYDMFPFNYIHNHLVRRGTHSSLGMDILAPLRSMLWRGLTHTFLSCSMGSVSVSQVPCLLNDFSSLNQVQDLVYSYEN